MEKTFIQNRKGQKVAVIVEQNENPKGLAFVMHGLGGSKDQPLIVEFAETFKEKGNTVVRFDTTNTFGESDGKYENATITNYYEDLEDVISWASKQTWYREPFILCGHSLGGISIALFSEKYPEKVRALAPISTAVSSTLFLDTHPEEELKQWKELGYKISERQSKPGAFKKLNWTYVEDRLKYDLLEKADRLTMPVFLMVGENDTSAPPKHQQILFDKLPGKKELHIIKGAPHTFRDREHVDEVKMILSDWIDKL